MSDIGSEQDDGSCLCRNMEGTRMTNQETLILNFPSGLLQMPFSFLACHLTIEWPEGLSPQLSTLIINSRIILHKSIYQCSTSFFQKTPSSWKFLNWKPNSGLPLSPVFEFLPYATLLLVSIYNENENEALSLFEFQIRSTSLSVYSSITISLCSFSI